VIAADAADNDDDDDDDDDDDGRMVTNLPCFDNC